MDATTKVRLLLSNVIADAGSMRDIVNTELRNASDIEYLTHEVDRLQATAHRIVAFLDTDVVGLERQ